MSRPAGDESKKQSSRGESRESEVPNFPVVGIGASAGGLEACREFFEAMPAECGMAFIVVMHLEPRHESRLAEILSKRTAMSVSQVKDRMPIRPHSVYVIPPDRYLSISDQHFCLTTTPKDVVTRAPITFFFRSLAEVCKEKAVCIIMSGAGADGTDGMKEIKINGGLAIVQDPEEALHKNMPQNAIETGLVDLILPVSRMPQVLLRYARHPYVDGTMSRSRSTRRTISSRSSPSSVRTSSRRYRPSGAFTSASASSVPSIWNSPSSSPTGD